MFRDLCAKIVFYTKRTSVFDIFLKRSLQYFVIIARLFISE